ncbi:hypothetical protein ID866_4569 [Astraeus odoratus]|nr:hypothetical protein ID866_4569 [Astraeus odoratus]
MMPLRRHSGLTSATSRFSGVSLLASPRDSSRQHPQASPSNSPAQQGSLGLLSPVQLSAKLRPFSLQLIDSAFKRGGSIDSGYADGESWVDPEPLSRSPPPKACPVSYDVRPIRRPPSLVQSPEGSILEGPEDESHDVTSSIFDAYDDPSSDVEDDCPSPTMRVDTCLSGEFGYLTPGHNLNPNPGTSVQPFIAVDDNASLKTALSTQPSFEFSDGSSRVFSLRRDSRLSLQSGTSTPNTSLFSHDSDAWRVEEEEPVSPVSDIRTTSSNEKTKRGKRRGVTDESIPPDIACGEVHNEEAQASVMLTRSEEDGKVDTFIDSDITFMPPLPSPYEGRAAKTSNDSKFQENPHLLCSTHESFAGEGATQFPLPLAFELTGHSTLAEDAVPLQNSALDDTAGEQLFPDPLDACTTRPRAASNLTIVADLNNSTMTSALTSAGDEGQQRNRAESDLTVKGQRITRSPPVAANLSVSSMNTMDLTPVIGDDRVSFSCSEAADLDSPRTSERAKEGLATDIIPNPSKVPSPIVSSSASLARNSLFTSRSLSFIITLSPNASLFSFHICTDPTECMASTLSCPYVLCEEDNVEDPSSSHPVESGYDHAARPASASEAPVHALATPKPTLLFAIASDDVEQVRKVLDNGEAGPNDAVGPQSALAFTLTNDKLAHKKDIVKALLAYGADPGALRNPTLNPAARVEEGDADPPPETTLEGMDPATRYFVTRADAAHTRQTSRLIYRSFFRPLMREIEKTEDQKALWSLLMPWELGRCSLEAGKRHVDVHNIIWLGTSNIGHELVFEYHRDRPEPDKQMTREEYLQLTEMLRPRVSDCLGTSLLSRVTTVLPFVPFTLEEKKAIAAEAVYSLGSDAAMALSPQEVEDLVMRALPNYVPGEGARSLHRAISNQLVDAL